MAVNVLKKQCIVKYKNFYVIYFTVEILLRRLLHQYVNVSHKMAG